MSFAEYLDRMAAVPRSIDVATRCRTTRCACS